MSKVVLRGWVAVVAVYALTACGSATDRPAGGAVPATAQPTGPTAAPRVASPAVPPTGGPGYSAALSARLVTADLLPPGFEVDIATTMGRDAGDHRPAADAPCSDSMLPLLSASRLTGTPSAMAAATVSRFDAGSDDLWVGAEILRTYADDGARRAMTDLRTFIGRCPTAESSLLGRSSYRYAIEPGPRLGDDSMYVRCSSTSDSVTLGCDSVLVRIGTTLLVVTDQGSGPGDDDYLPQVAEAAVRGYQATGS